MPWMYGFEFTSLANSALETRLRLLIETVSFLKRHRYIHPSESFFERNNVLSHLLHASKNGSWTGL